MMQEQIIARSALGKFTKRLNDPNDDPYVSGDERDVLGEDQHGSIMAPKAGTDDYWELFNFRKPGHMTAWNETRQSGRLAFLDLESDDSRPTDA